MAATPKKLVFYVQMNKRKALKVYTSFAMGARVNSVSITPVYRPKELVPDVPAVFYGVSRDTAKIFKECRYSGMPYYYIDNCYMGVRGNHHRVSRNGAFCTPDGRCDIERFRELDIPIKPRQKGGKNILVTLQTPEFFDWVFDLDRADWVDFVVRELRKYTDRPIIVRDKPAPTNIGPGSEGHRSFLSELRDAWALVTMTSATGVEALFEGVPVFTTHETFLEPVACRDFSKIEDPPMPDEPALEQWGALLAGNQWRMAEMRRGLCWRQLHE